MERHAPIADGFLAAAVEPHRWRAALGVAASALRSDHAEILAFGTDFGVGFNAVSGLGADAMRPFKTIDHASPLINYRVAANEAAPWGNVLHEAHYAAARPMLANDTYVDLVHRTDIPHGCQIQLRRDDDGVVGFGLLRSSRTGPTTARVRADFATLAPAAASATALQVALECDGHRLIAGSFDVMGIACFVLDRSLKVRAHTASAEALLREGVLTLADGRVALPVAAHDRRLAAAMNALVAGRSLAGHIVVPDGPGSGGGGVMTLKLHRLPMREWDMGYSPAAILVVKRSRQPGFIDATVLRETYHLTGAETEIALLLSAGHPRDVICAVRGITRETLRTHLRALFAKLGVNREAEALHLLYAVLR